MFTNLPRRPRYLRLYCRPYLSKIIFFQITELFSYISKCCKINFIQSTKELRSQKWKINILLFFLSKNSITIVFSNHSIYQMQLSSLHYKQTNKISVISTKFSNIQLKHNCKQMVFQYKYEVEYQQNASQMPNKCRIRKSQNQLSHWRWTEQLVIVDSRPFDVQVCVRSDASLIDRI